MREKSTQMTEDVIGGAAESPQVCGSHCLTNMSLNVSWLILGNLHLKNMQHTETKNP